MALLRVAQPKPAFAAGLEHNPQKHFSNRGMVGPKWVFSVAPSSYLNVPRDIFLQLLERIRFPNFGDAEVNTPRT